MNQENFIQTESKTIINTEGKIMLYSVDDFYNNIVIGDDCFICGAKRGSKEFNDEHILPDWVLTKYNLHGKSITLSNGAKFEYGRYTVPCCAECNTELGKKLEIPVSKLLKLSYAEICQAVKNDQSNLFLLFKWLMLIFFKTHIKDTEFRWNLDRRKGDEKISDAYDWQDMHHIHCMVRMDYTKAIVDTQTIGTILILPAIQNKIIEPFDFTDNAAGKAIMIRLDEFSVICVLNDSCAGYSLFHEEIDKIKSALAPLQLRELFSHIVYIVTNLKEKPSYYSQFLENGEYHIKAKVPEIAELIEEDKRETTFGEIMYYYCNDVIVGHPSSELILGKIKDGKYTYLRNDKGEFLDYSENLKTP